MTNKQTVSEGGSSVSRARVGRMRDSQRRVSDANRVPTGRKRRDSPPRPDVSGRRVSVSPRGVQDTRVDTLWRERAGAAQSEFCLGSGDLLEMSVPRVDDMQALRARIDPAGMITLPHVGAIQAAGLTESQLA